jgi:hypothetical protein
MQHPFADGLDPESIEERVAELRMPLDDRILGVGQRARRVQDRIRQPDLSQVVEQAGEAEVIDHLRLDAEL